MNVCDVKKLLEKVLLGTITLDDFAEKISKVWPKHGLFDDPMRKDPDKPMNQTLFNIINYIFESGDIYDSELAKKGVINIIGDAEFRKDILTTYKKLVIFIHENPEYRCPED